MKDKIEAQASSHFGGIIVSVPGCGQAYSKTAEAFLLMAILEELRKMRRDAP